MGSGVEEGEERERGLHCFSWERERGEEFERREREALEGGGGNEDRPTFELFDDDSQILLPTTVFFPRTGLFPISKKAWISPVQSFFGSF